MLGSVRAYHRRPWHRPRHHRPRLGLHRHLESSSVWISNVALDASVSCTDRDASPCLWLARALCHWFFVFDSCQVAAEYQFARL